MILITNIGKFVGMSSYRQNLENFAKLVNNNYHLTLEALLANSPERAASIIQKKADFIGETQKLETTIQMAGKQNLSGNIPVLEIYEIFYAFREIFELSVDICDLIG